MTEDVTELVDISDRFDDMYVKAEEKRRSLFYEEYSRFRKILSKKDYEILTAMYERNCILDKMKTLTGKMNTCGNILGYSVKDITREYMERGVGSEIVVSAVGRLRKTFFRENGECFSDIDFDGLKIDRNIWSSDSKLCDFLFSRNGVLLFSLRFPDDLVAEGNLAYLYTREYLGECIGVVFFEHLSDRTLEHRFNSPFVEDISKMISEFVTNGRLDFSDTKTYRDFKHDVDVAMRDTIVPDVF